MNDFLLINAIVYSAIGLCVFIIVGLIIKNGSGYKRFFAHLMVLVVVAIVVCGIQYGRIVELEKAFTAVDKNTVDVYDGIYSEQMTDLTLNRLYQSFDLISLVVGENFCITVHEDGEFSKVLSQSGDITITKEEAIEIARSEKNYVITDIRYTYEEHQRVPRYNIYVEGDMFLVISIDAVTGDRRDVYIGLKGVKNQKHLDKLIKEKADKKAAKQDS